MAERTRVARTALPLCIGGVCCAFALASPPLAPTVTWPPARAVVGVNRLDITWTGGSHDKYEIHIGSYNSPTSANLWDSGQVAVAQPASTAQTPALTPQQTAYVFIRLHNVDGWGPWSDAGVYFYIAGEWMNDPYQVQTAGGQQRDHSIAFNPDRNEYLVSYMDIQSGDRPYVNAWRLNSSAARIGPEIHSLGGLEGAGATAAAYNSVNHEYLAVGRDYHAHLFGQRVNAADSSLPGAAVFIHNTSSTLEHAVAYGSGSNVYLEAWRDDGGSACSAVLAQRMAGATGAPVGGVITIVSIPGICVGGPKIAYNSTADEFLVTYQLVPPSDQQDLYCRRVRASDGALLGAAATPVAVTSQTEWNNGIAYDSDLNRYLVAYEMFDPDFSVRGQFIAADATLIGSRFDIVGSPWNGGAPTCSWNATSKEYLVSWLHGTSNANYARRLSQTGALITEPFRTNGALEGIGNFGPIAIANAINNDFLICWQNSHTDVYVRRYKAYPLPAPDVSPPAPVTGLSALRYAHAVELHWTNPATQDFAGTTIRVKTTGFPSGPADGTLVVDQPNVPSSSDSYLHSGLSRGPYYYAVFAHDEVPNYATAVTIQVNVLPGDFDGDGDIDQLDFAHLQLCLSGAAVAYTPPCRDADLDDDGDVDGVDFGVFANCMGGSDLPVGC